MHDMSFESEDFPPRAAALLDDGTLDIDALLAQLAAEQHRRGRRVRGLVMTHPDEYEGCARPMVLVDIDSGRQYLVSQNLGSGSTACRADAQGFARASRVLRDALAQAPELVISNRFGGLEAEGGGFADEMLALMAAGIPLLTVVGSQYRDAWRAYSGGAPLLPADAAAATAWIDQALAARAA